ncbi:hypothetical protein [Streptomyces sp. NPDC051016]
MVTVDGQPHQDRAERDLPRLRPVIGGKAGLDEFIHVKGAGTARV